MGRGRDLWRLIRHLVRLGRDTRLLDEIELILTEIHTEVEEFENRSERDVSTYPNVLADLVADLDEKRALTLNLDGSFEELRDAALLLLAEVRMANGRPAQDVGRKPL
ncbi:hypothetical protein EDD29_2384 [Actinocorallia herbida]|uniref:Uncharacterized protein n=1 Tax=Actinocorallia herbida TaxID=58109 RepID=A0A3N1CUE9_9ACTN|nr:hypothetical protein [Actinocorallia herbida]ROO84855.1 hypothetical protein EDD29_2384 [Actinocorallia herbida]